MLKKTLITFILLSTTTTFAASVNRVSHRGKGCPVGSVSTAFAPDVSAFTIIYDQMQAQLLPTSPRLDDRTGCLTYIDLSLAPGEQLVVEHADYRGAYYLADDAVWAVYRTVFYFDNGAARVGNSWFPPTNFMGGFRMSKQGPAAEEFLWNADTGGIKQITNCGGNVRLTILNQAGLSARRISEGTASFDTMDTNLVHSYRVSRTNCQYKFRPYPENQKRPLNPNVELGGIDGPTWSE